MFYSVRESMDYDDAVNAWAKADSAGDNNSLYFEHGAEAMRMNRLTPSARIEFMQAVQNYLKR